MRRLAGQFASALQAASALGRRSPYPDTPISGWLAAFSMRSKSGWARRSSGNTANARSADRRSVPVLRRRGVKSFEPLAVRMAFHKDGL